MKKGVLLILDGYGENNDTNFNAVANAKSPYLNSLRQQPHSLLKTYGSAVGLFDNEMGGSEVGHTTIGAGRIVPSIAKRIHDDIQSKQFEKNENIVKMLTDIKDKKSNIHFVGLLSDKNVHSDFNHLLELIRISKNKAKYIFIHIITDGRDSGMFDSLKYVKTLKKYIADIKNCKIASISGRFYAMDRENNIERTERAFNGMFFETNNEMKAEDIEKYLTVSHKANITDEFIEPKRVQTDIKISVKTEDYVFFYNFREDRLRQMVKMAEKLNCRLITMSKVGGVNAKSIYESEKVKYTLSEYLSTLNLKQIKISESTKYAHVTYFLNGGEEHPFKYEDRIHIPTIKVDSFDKTPKMRAKEITKLTIKSIEKGYDAVIVNFSNSDMLGHTGNYKATIKAIEYLDKCVKKIAKVAKNNDYFILLTADHGNADVMRTKEGEPNTAHTLNPVMCVAIDDEIHQMKARGGLKDVAPTFLDLMGVEPNKYFDGKSLLK